MSVVSVELTISASANGGFCNYKYKIVNALYITTTNLKVYTFDMTLASLSVKTFGFAFLKLHIESILNYIIIGK